MFLIVFKFLCKHKAAADSVCELTVEFTAYGIPTSLHERVNLHQQFSEKLRNPRLPQSVNFIPAKATYFFKPKKIMVLETCTVIWNNCRALVRRQTLRVSF